MVKMILSACKYVTSFLALAHLETENIIKSVKHIIKSMKRKQMLNPNTGDTAKEILSSTSLIELKKHRGLHIYHDLFKYEILKPYTQWFISPVGCVSTEYQGDYLRYYILQSYLTFMKYLIYQEILIFQKSAS